MMMAVYWLQKKPQHTVVLLSPPTQKHWACVRPSGLNPMLLKVDQWHLAPILPDSAGLCICFLTLSGNDVCWVAQVLQRILAALSQVWLASSVLDNRYVLMCHIIFISIWSYRVHALPKADLFICICIVYLLARQPEKKGPNHPQWKHIVVAVPVLLAHMIAQGTCFVFIFTVSIKIPGQGRCLFHSLQYTHRFPWNLGGDHS